MNEEKHSKEHRKKKTRVYSEAFPPNKLGYREKNPAFSEVHKILSKIDIDENDVYFRELSQGDINELHLLHKEWFPVDYDSNFFEKVLIPDKRDREHINIGAIYKFENKEYILGSILCEIKTENEFRSIVPDEFLTFIDISLFEDLNVFKPNYEFAYIMTIGVIDECRKLKLGSKLLNKVIEILMQREKCLAIYLHVVHYNNTAINFYIRNNFIEVTTLKNYYKLKDEIYDSKVFVKFFNLKEREKVIAKNKNILTKIFDIIIIFPIQILIFILSFGFLCRCLRRKHKLD